MPQIIPSLWFADNNCEEAVNYYTSVFPNSEIRSITYYPDAKLDKHFEGMEGKVLTAEFTLDGQDYIALDGGPYFRFNEAISFTISCADQEEIDYYWSKLSHVEASEQCGWVKDQFGLSWQIVPANMAALQTNSAQIQALMTMKKIIISELEALA
ncbi:MAG: VOC family protein [Gallicola sp.]|nr:VOC family protein [Gallicola sp.]